MPRSFEPKRVVHQDKGLQRSVGALTAGASGVVNRHIQGVHIGHGRHAVPKSVKTAPGQNISMILDVGFGVAAPMATRFPKTRRLIRLYAPSPNFFAEKNACRRCAVA